MSDKRKVKEIVKSIRKEKKRVASKLDKKIEKHEHLFSMFTPVVAGLLFLVFSVINLTSSIWFDESYSAYLVRGNFGEIWNMTAMDVHPPLYYFALKMWSSIFGTSDFALRFMSIFFGLVAIVFIFHAVKRWFGTKTAILATLFAAISPMFIRYGQEMRMYTMVLLIVAVATYVLSLALEKGAEKAGRKWWILYAILIATGMWTHYFSAFAWIAHIMMIIYHFGGVKKIFKNKKLLKMIGITYGVAVALFIPWIPSFFKQIVTVQSGFWIPPVSFNAVADFIASALFFNKAQEVVSWGWVFGTALLVVFIISFVLVYKRANEKNRHKIILMSILMGAPVAVMTILSLPPLTSSFVDRYVLYSIVALWVMFAVVAVMLKNGVLRQALITLVLIVAGFGVVFVENREPKGYIKEIISEVFIGAEEGEPIIANNVWTYYDGIFYSSEQHPIYLFEKGVGYEYGSLEPIRNYRVNLISDSAEFLKNYEKVWYIIDTPVDGSDFEIPEWAKKMRVVSEISLDHHSALEFSKN